MSDSPQGEKWTNLSSCSSDQPEIVLTAAGTDDKGWGQCHQHSCQHVPAKLPENKASFKALVCERWDKERGGPN